MWNTDVSVSAGTFQKKKKKPEFRQIHCLLIKLDFKRPPPFWWLVVFGLFFLCLFLNAEAPGFPLVEKELLIFFFLNELSYY